MLFASRHYRRDGEGGRMGVCLRVGLGLGVAADETGERALRWLPLLSLVHAFALPDDHPYRAGVTFQKLKHRVWTGSPG